jgi:hypothetical protein
MPFLDSQRIQQAPVASVATVSSGVTAPHFVLGPIALVPAISASTTQFVRLSNTAPNAQENNAIVPSLSTLTITQLVISTSAAQSGTGTLTLQVRKAQANSALSVVVPAGGAAGLYSTASTVTFAPKDLFSISAVNAATAASTAFSFTLIGT